MRFDYLHSPRPLFLTRLLELRIPERLYGALLALLGATAVISGACGIEAYRLHEARTIESVYMERHAQAARALQRTNLYYDRVRALVDLDRLVRRIAASGDTDARTLAEIANRMPQHAWLTAIAHDGTGMALEGRARDLQVLSGVLRDLMRSKSLHSPTLVTAAAETEQGRDAGVTYRIHVDGAAP